MTVNINWKGSLKCLTANGSSDNSRIVTKDCNRADANQNFKIEGGSIKLIGTTKSLNVQNGMNINDKNNIPVVLYEHRDEGNSKISTRDGFIFWDSAPGKCLAVQDGMSNRDRENGIVTWTCNNQDGNQKFDIINKETYNYFPSTDYGVGDIAGGGDNLTLEQCMTRCDTVTGCTGFIRDTTGTHCYLKNIPSSSTAEPRYDAKWGYYYKGAAPSKGAANLVYSGSGDTREFYIRSKKTDKCIEKVNSGWSSWLAFGTKQCENKPSQKITFIQRVAGSNDYSMKTEDNYFVVTPKNLVDGQMPDDVRALWQNDLGGSGKHGYFNIKGIGKNSEKTGIDALVSGPVEIGSSHYTGQRFHVDDEGWIRNYTRGDADNSQYFINNELYSTCQQRGISFNDCTKSLLDDCKAPVNQNFITAEKCPKEYCSQEKNVSKEECKQVCDTNPGLCDSPATAYCSKAENKDKEFCNCFGEFPETPTSKEAESQGFILRRECNLSSCVNNQKSYKTDDMKKRSCPSLQVCIQGIETGTIGGPSNFSNVNFTCNQNDPLPAATPYNPNMTADEEESQQESETNKKEKSDSLISPLFVVIGVVVVIFAILIMILRR